MENVGRVTQLHPREHRAGRREEGDTEDCLGSFQVAHHGSHPFHAVETLSNPNHWEADPSTAAGAGAALPT